MTLINNESLGPLIRNLISLLSKSIALTHCTTALKDHK